MKMKKNTLKILLCLNILLFLSCGGGSSSKVGESEPSTVVAGTEDNALEEVDTSLPLTQQLNKIFSNMEPNSSFYDLKIKEVSQPSKFVGTWTMWNNFVGDTSQINADGSCSDEFFYYKTGEKKKSDCLQWYHVTLEENDVPVLLFIYKNNFSLVSYEWSGNDNLYLYYYGGDGQLATRANSTVLAQNVKERFLLGTWVQETSDLRIFWTFDSNQRFLVETYRASDNKLVIDKEGKWTTDGKSIEITGFNAVNNEDSYIRRSIPPQNIELDYLYGLERLGIRDFSRYSEPLMISNDPYIGKFQAHSTYNSYNAISLNVAKTNASNYSVDIYWNDNAYLENYAKKVDGLLHVETEFGTIIFKPVINGIQKINRLENKRFNFPKRILKVSQDPSKKKTTLLGRWVQSVHYSLPEKYRYFTFFKDGTFFHKNADYDTKIGSSGTYRKDNNKLYLKARCGKEEIVDTINRLNEAHYSPSSYKTTAFVKIKNSESTMELFNALRQYEIAYKKRSIKLIPHPKHQNKFLFSKDMTYSNIGFISMHFKSNGEMFTNFSGQYQPIYQDYYIEVSNEEMEKIVLLKSSSNISTVSNPEELRFYSARQTMCYEDTWELGLE